jgi:Domain of unknown function (DUF4145)
LPIKLEKGDLIVQLSYAVQDAQIAPTLAMLLKGTALFLWKEWSRDMQAILRDPQNRKFNLRGVCPHCTRESAFLLVTSVFAEITSDGGELWIAGMQCQGCLEYILAIIRFNQYTGSFNYVEHYPLGKPDDNVATEIPDTIKPDFKEALRCRFVNAYNATVEMCRRALEASCIQQGASSDLVLAKMIDWVHAQGKITTPLKDMAHKIKLGGNRGAHPSSKILTKEDADAVIEFTWEYFHHVYVMPALMARHDFDKPDKNKTP